MESSEPCGTVRLAKKSVNALSGRSRRADGRHPLLRTGPSGLGRLISFGPRRGLGPLGEEPVEPAQPVALPLDVTVVQAAKISDQPRSCSFEVSAKEPLS
jgi:hypothetical protein